MKTIAITIVTACFEGSLSPRHDEETDYIVLESPASATWPCGVNVDNLVILDFDASRILASVEILIPYRLWRRDALGAMPTRGRAGCLALPEKHTEKTLFVTPDHVEACVDPDILVGEVILGDANAGDAEYVRLSPLCCATISNGKLTGFNFQLSRNIDRHK